ncbi:MAG: HEAT repeat domain-containing protein [Terriglobia bacterium]|jgi:hypothetical protein
MKCTEIEQQSLLYIHDELAPNERADLEAHVAACEPCRRGMEQARRLDQLLRECPRPEPAPDLLVVCRQSLDESLDREQLGWRGLFRSFVWHFGTLPATRATAILTLLVFGFGLGWTIRPHATALQPVTSGDNSSAFDTSNLNNVRIRSISQVAPDPQSGGVRITLDAERRVTLEGSLDDPRIRQVLVDAVKGYDNPGIRRDTLDVLRARTQDPSVREALMYALHDGNPGVRLAALQTVGSMECGPDTHAGLLKVVENDANVGVRTAAIDTLVRHLEEEGPDEAVTTTFERLANTDQNPSVRMRCLAALRNLQGSDAR